jgi:hypothetical protein
MSLVLSLAAFRRQQSLLTTTLRWGTRSNKRTIAEMPEANHGEMLLATLIYALLERGLHHGLQRMCVAVACQRRDSHCAPTG